MRKRSKVPPMIAIIRGRPSAPARAKDSGVPPTPIQRGKSRLMRTRIHALTFQCGTEPPFPDEMGLVAEFPKEVKLLREELVVVPRIETKQRIGFAE